MLTGEEKIKQRSARAASWQLAAASGFIFAVLLALLAVRFIGLEILCKKQILCTASTSPGWASQVHLSWEADPASSITVSWHSDSTDNPARVEYRPTGVNGWQQAEGKSIALPPNGLLKTRGAIHRVTIEGLDPDTTYEYRVSNDRKASAAMGVVFQTRTMPAAPAPISAIYIADIGLAGRPDGLTTGVMPLLDFLAQSDVHVLLGGGDYASSSGDGRYFFPEEAIDEWFRQFQPVLSRLPFMPTYGNHEIFLKEGFDIWAPRFGHEDGFGGGRAYSFDIGKTHFTSMFIPGQGYLPSDELLEWLDDDLASARSNGADWLIVYQHDQVFGHGSNHPADPQLRPLLMPILEKHNVDLLLSAQDQNYERTFPLRTGTAGYAIASCDPSGYMTGAGVTYMKVSPAGKMSDIGRDFSRFSGPVPPQIAVSSDDGFHFARLDISGEALAVTVFRLRLGQSKPVEFDQFVVRRRNGEQRVIADPKAIDNLPADCT